MLKSRRFSSYFSFLTIISILFIFSHTSLAANAPIEGQQSSWASKPEQQWQSVQVPARTYKKIEKKNEVETLPFSPGTHNYGLQVGQIFLMGDLASKRVDSLGYRMQYTYGVSELFGFNLTVGYSDHNDNFSILTVNSDVRINLSWYDRVVPFAALGLGFYNLNMMVQDRFNNMIEISPMLFGLHVSGGANLILTDAFFIGTQLDIHNIFTSTKTYGTGASQTAAAAQANNSTSMNGSESFNTESKKIGGTFTSFLFSAGMKF